jgi:hypothetical protein
MIADATPSTAISHASDAAVTPPTDDNAVTLPEPISATTPDDEETTILRREGLPPDAVILAPSVAATPMRQPDNTWALLVLAADVLDDTHLNRYGDVVLFVGSWLPDQPPAAGCEGDLVLVLTAPEGESPPQDRVDVDMLLAHDNRWMRVGEWQGMDPRWPWPVARTAAAMMGLHVEATETAGADLPPRGTTAGRSLQGWNGTGGLVDLLSADLIRVDEEFVWDRPGYGARHTAHIHSDGVLVLADGRAYANPSGALTALGGKNQNGWNTWRRTSDGRALGDLRAELRARHGLTTEPHRRR